jgi:hypothetical protein
MPLVPAFAALTVSIGEAAGIGAGLVGIAAGIKGSADYKKAETIREGARRRCLGMAERIRRKARSVQNRLEEFAGLKLRAYTGIIREAAQTLSAFKPISLSAFRDIQVERISFFQHDPGPAKKPSGKAGNALSCLSAGLITAANDRIPYKGTPPILKAAGIFGVNPVSGLPAIPYSAIAVAGLSWGISGSAAKAQAGNAALYAGRAIGRMEQTLSGFDALLERIGEGESLVNALAKKLRDALSVLPDAPGGPETAAAVESAVALARALKEIIETDICTGGGLPNAESGVVFQKIRKEYAHV